MNIYHSPDSPFKGILHIIGWPVLCNTWTLKLMISNTPHQLITYGKFRYDCKLILFSVDLKWNTCTSSHGITPVKNDCQMKHVSFDVNMWTWCHRKWHALTSYYHYIASVIDSGRSVIAKPYNDSQNYGWLFQYQSRKDITVKHVIRSCQNKTMCLLQEKMMRWKKTFMILCIMSLRDKNLQLSALLPCLFLDKIALSCCLVIKWCDS